MSDARAETRPALPPPAGGPAPVRAGTAGGPVRVNSAELFGGAVEVQIDHHGAVYRLKQTALGKLILTK